jgi:hypothetical protein
MLQERGEYLHGTGPDDIASFLRFCWPYELSKIDPIELNGQRRLIVWINVDAGAAAVSLKSDPADELTYIGDCQARWRSRNSRRMICSCGSDQHEAAVGRQLNDEGWPVWVVVGTRCPECGFLSSPVDWNVD